MWQQYQKRHEPVFFCSPFVKSKPTTHLCLEGLQLETQKYILCIRTDRTTEWSVQIIKAGGVGVEIKRHKGDLKETKKQTLHFSLICKVIYISCSPANKGCETPDRLQRYFADKRFSKSKLLKRRLRCVYMCVRACARARARVCVCVRACARE